MGKWEKSGISLQKKSQCKGPMLGGESEILGAWEEVAFHWCFLPLLAMIKGSSGP